MKNASAIKYSYLAFLSWQLTLVRGKRRHLRFSKKKAILKKIVKFIGRHLCLSLFLIKLQTLGFQLYLKKQTLEQVCSCKNPKNVKNTSLKNTSGWVVLPALETHLVWCFKINVLKFLQLSRETCLKLEIKLLKQNFLRESLIHDNSEATTRGSLYEKMLIKISQNSQKNTCARDSGTGVFLRILRNV